MILQFTKRVIQSGYWNLPFYQAMVKLFCSARIRYYSPCISERLLIPTVQFSVKGVRDLSPNQNEVIIFPTVLQNIGNAYNPGTGVFTAPTNGTYTFSMQACTVNSRFAYFQLVVDSSDTVILVIRNYENTAATTTSDSVPHSLTVGKRVWIQSHFNSGITNMLYHNEPTCCNHFSGVLVNS